MHPTNLAAQCVGNGGVLAYPTEYCFGLGCLPENSEAIYRILEIKSRSPDKGLILVADKIERLVRYINWDSLTEAQQQKAIGASTPTRSTSWLVPASKNCSKLLKGQFPTIAIRITHYDLLANLCAAANSALVSTSANRSRADPLITAQQVEAELGQEVDYILDQPVQGVRQASQIVDIITNEIIRT